MTTEEEREDDEGKVSSCSPIRQAQVGLRRTSAGGIAFVIPAHAGIRWRSNIRHVRVGEHPPEECKQILAFARMTREGSEDDEGRERG